MRSIVNLFDVLNLFAHLLDHDFQVNRRIRLLGMTGFRAKGVGFAI
jgi:hypothetical protein